MPYLQSRVFAERTISMWRLSHAFCSVQDIHLPPRPQENHFSWQCSGASQTTPCLGSILLYQNELAKNRCPNSGGVKTLSFRPFLCQAPTFTGESKKKNVPGSPVAVSCPCTLPQKPATVTGTKAHLGYLGKNWLVAPIILYG